MSEINPLIVAETINALGNVKVNHNLTIGGQITVAGTINSNNANISGVTGVVNLHAASVISRGLVTAGAIKTDGAVTAAGNITSNGIIAGANVLSSGLISASANIVGGNLKILGDTVVVGSITTVGSIIAPVGSITANSITAQTAFQLPVYADENARDQAISDPSVGMLVVVGNTFQGYANGAWGNLALG